MDIYFKKEPYGLIPLYESDKSSYDKIKIGEEIKAQISIPRNIQFHKKFFALLNIAFKNQSVTNHFEAFRRWMICEAGYYTVVTTPDGVTTREPESIAFANMSEERFERLYKDMVQVVITVIGATEEQIESELINFL